MKRPYAAFGRVVTRAVGPVLRLDGRRDSPFLDRRRASHEDAMLAQSDDHWDALIERYGLRGFESILDIGCGAGAWLPAMARQNARVVGVDVDDGPLALARRQAAEYPAIEIARMSAEELAFPDGSFDAVVCFSSLPYLDEDVALAEMRRVLRPGGRLAIGTVGSGYYAKHVAEGIRSDDAEAVAYGLDPIIVSLARAVAGRRVASSSLRAWTPRALRRLLARHGFQLESVRRDADAVDPTWAATYLGRPVYFIEFARKSA